jgi:hypothetical protein
MREVADQMAQAVARARLARERAVAAGADARGEGLPTAAPNLDAIASATQTVSAQDAQARQVALRARQHRQEVREAVEAMEVHAAQLGEGLAVGRVDESAVIAALRELDELRLALRAWDLAARAAHADAALIGRR